MSRRIERQSRGPGLPLAIAGTGERVVCIEITGGGGIRRRMADLGILPGTRMTVISGGDEPGPVMVNVGDGRGKLMLGRGMSQRVLVRPA